MEIYGKSQILKTLFKDLKKGEVFFFYKDYKKDFSDWQIYMRCGHTNEYTAVNLETGICYSFDKNEPVEIVSATISITQKSSGGNYEGNEIFRIWCV